MPRRPTPSPVRVVASALLLVVAAALLATAPGPAWAAAKKALFDNTHAETAGNADWQIDTDQPIPLPAESGIGPATPRTYWLGAISSWGVDLVKRGYSVATLTTTYGITYGNAGNPYDLAKYDVFIVDEPNTRFTAAEAAAIFSFVQDGGGLVMVVDHSGSDRNSDGWDSPAIWNDFDPTRRFGVRCAVANEANNNIVQTSTNVNASPADSVIRGPVGTVTGLAFHNGTTFTLDTAANPRVRGEVWMNSYPQGAVTGVMAASSVYGNGRLVIVGDSSPADDGSATGGNSNIYDGWGEAGATDSTLFLNATIWATRRSPIVDTAAPVVDVLAPAGGGVWKAGSTQSVTWNATDNVGVTAVDLAYSLDGGATFPYAIATGVANTGAYPWTVPNAPTTTARVRVVARDAAGNAGRDSSATDFTIDTWTIVAGAGAGGSVVPAGAVPVVEGTSPTFAIHPSAGWAVSALIVDGIGVVADTLYTFPNVAADHTLNALFADVAPPAVAVTSPAGGERWDAGSAHDVTWTASDNAGVDSIDVDYSAHGADGPWLPVAHGLANTGQYGWTVPAAATDSALVRITARDAAQNEAFATGDSVFHVVDPTVGVGDGGPGGGAGAGPAVLALAAPAPNPVHGEAVLRFSLPAAGAARLEIVDAAGRRVWRHEGRFEAGAQALRWDGRGGTGARVPAGLYFVRLSTPWGARTQRLVRVD